MPIYEWKRTVMEKYDEPVGKAVGRFTTEYTTTEGSIHDPVPVPEGEGWVREYNYQVGKVSGVGDSPSRSVTSKRT